MVPRAVALVAAVTAAGDDDSRLLAVVAIGGLHAIWWCVHDRCRCMRNRWEHRGRLIVRLGTSGHGCGHGHDLDGRWDVVRIGNRLGHRVPLRHHLHTGRRHLDRLGHGYTVRGALNLLGLHDDAADASS